MVRRGQNNRQSLNSSVVTVTNNSVVEEKDQNNEQAAPDYNEFVKRFGRPDLGDAASNDQNPLIGYEQTIKKLRERIDNLLNTKESRDVDFALLTGPSGTGKTTTVRRLAQEYTDADKKLSYFYLKSSWTLEKQFGNPEQRLRLLFDEAVQKSPSLIFIDKIELICCEKRHHHADANRVFNVLEDKLEMLNNSPSARVLVLAATDRPDLLDAQCRKPCYFGDEIRFTLPTRDDRVAMLRHILSSAEFGNLHELTEDQIDQVAEASHCYSYRDLKKLCNNATGADAGHRLTFESLRKAQKQFKPVAIASITTPCPPLRWSDIGGVDDVKRELQESVIWPLEHRDKFQRLGICSNKGAILYGPPGCSKTMLAQALATESGYNFISVKGPELFSKWVGDSEAAVRRLYRNAREIAPCIIFFDEIDGLAPERSESSGSGGGSSVGDKVVAQLLTELNGVEPLDNVFTIAATNRPDRVDSALLRPGRLDPSIYIPLPSSRDRREIFKVHMRPLALELDSMPSSSEASSSSTAADAESPNDAAAEKLAKLTDGYSGAEIANVCRVAGTLALRESLSNEHIAWKHFELALAKVRPRTRAEHLRAYEKFHERSLQHGSVANQAEPLPTAAAAPIASAAAAAADSGDEAPIHNLHKLPKERLSKLMRSLSLKRMQNK